VVGDDREAANFELTPVQERLSRAHNSVAVAAGQTVIELKRENCT